MSCILRRLLVFPGHAAAGDNHADSFHLPIDFRLAPAPPTDRDRPGPTWHFLTLLDPDILAPLPPGLEKKESSSLPRGALAGSRMESPVGGERRPGGGEGGEVYHRHLSYSLGTFSCPFAPFPPQKGGKAAEVDRDSPNKWSIKFFIYFRAIGQPSRCARSI